MGHIVVIARGVEGVGGGGGEGRRVFNLFLNPNSILNFLCGFRIVKALCPWGLSR